MALAALHVLGLSLAVDSVHPKLHLLLVCRLEQVKSTVCESGDRLGVNILEDKTTYLSLKTYFFFV